MDLLYILYSFLLSKYHVSLLSSASGNTHVLELVCSFIIGNSIAKPAINQNVLGRNSKAYKGVMYVNKFYSNILFL